MPANSVSAIIPAFNEERTIGRTIAGVWDIPAMTQVIVVDDGSMDGTADEAARFGARVIRLEKNIGKGGAINAGAGLAGGDIILLLDADIGESATRAAILLEPLLGGGADMAIAAFPRPANKGGFGFVQLLAGNGIKFFTGIKAEAPLSGQRAMIRKVFLDMLPVARGFGVEVDLTIKAVRKGYRVIEVPVCLSHRITGRDLKGFIHRGRQFYHVARTLLSLGRAGFGNA
ncbi:MAG: glycosyltransferase family 2 protein [Bacillota bacterium]